MNRWLKFIEKISQGSPGLFIAFVFLTYAIPTILIIHALRYLIGVDK